MIKVKRRRRGRTLLPLQRIIIARELHSGVAPKVVAMNWKISRSYLTRIQHQYLEYQLVWRPDMEPPALKEMES